MFDRLIQKQKQQQLTLVRIWVEKISIEINSFVLVLIYFSKRFQNFYRFHNYKNSWHFSLKKSRKE